MLNSPNLDEKTNQHLAAMASLRRFGGPPAQFWPAFLEAASGVSGASRAMLILKDPKDGSWKKLGEWSDGGHADRTSMAFTRELVEMGERAAQDGVVAHPLEQAATPDLKHFGVGVKLTLSRPEDICIAIFLLLNATNQQAREALLRLRLTADTPSSYLLNYTSGQAKNDVEKFANSLDVLTMLNAEKKFGGAALAFCNAVAARYNCDQTSLGWIEKGYISLKNISRMERFDKNMAIVKALEATMEEAFDQDDEIVWPQPDGTTFVSRDHEKFSKEHSSGNMASIPIRIDGGPIGVLTCERQSKPFTQIEVDQLRLTCDQAARRLADLKERDGWIGARAGRDLRGQFAKILGPEHTWLKVIAVLCTLILAVLVFGRFRYRVEGNFILKSDDVTYLTTPFDGFIKTVTVRPGDLVKSKGVLMQMDTDELALEEAAATADQVRYLREAEKSRATNGLAEMRIDLSLADQSKAKLDLLRHRIDQASIRAPFDGVLIEGDLRERVGSPIKQGDALFKITKLTAVYAEAQVNQRDIHNIQEGAAGEMAFVTQPRLKYHIKVQRIYPAAMPKEGENIFTVRCQVLDAPVDWWRPGMSGLVKIEAGKRNLFWILTHRTVDFLRLKLWW